MNAFVINGRYYILEPHIKLSNTGQVYLHVCTKLCNTVYYAVLLMMNEWIRSKHVEQQKTVE